MEKNQELLENQLRALENGKNSAPYSLLGIHTLNNSELIIRVFCPQAKQIVAVDIIDKNKQYPLTFKGYSGFFEGIVKDRKDKFLYSLDCEDHEGNKWSMIDPYQFESTFKKDELYLFGMGRDYEIHHKLGAHLLKVGQVEGVRFAVWAPHAKRVSVIGDFNNWDGRRNSMRFLPEQGVWEIFIPGLKPGDLYKYEILTQKEEILYKTDPYAGYYELRPNNAAIIYDENKYKWKDTKWMNARVNKAYYKEPISIYEVHIGSWKKHEDESFYTYREVADELASYVKTMGYTHVELMGIVEHPFDGSWGYQVTGYFAPTSRYGTPDDFKYFVDVMHKNNIGVILDWVPAHFPKDAFALEKFDGEALYERSNEKEANHPHWGTLIFDYSKPQVSLFLISSALSWLGNYHVDGLRVDAVASMLYLDYGRQNDFVPNQYGGKENIDAISFIKHLNEIAYTRVPGIMMIAEESTAWPKVSHPVSEGGLGFGFKWNMGWMNDFLSYMKTPCEYRSREHGKVTFSLTYAFSENFIQDFSHDEVVHGKASMIYKMPGSDEEKFDQLKAAYGYLYGHPGKKMLFMGSEFAQTNEWNEKASLNWELLNYAPHQGIQKFVKELNHIYTKEKAFWELGNAYENFEWIDCNNAEQSVISYIRKAPESNEQVIVINNFSKIGYESYRIGVPELGEYEEILNSDAAAFNGANRINGKLKATDVPWHGKNASIEVTIPPLSAIFFKFKPIKKAKKETSSAQVVSKEVKAKVEKSVEKSKEKTSTKVTSDKKAKVGEKVKVTEENTGSIDKVIKTASKKKSNSKSKDLEKSIGKKKVIEESTLSDKANKKTTLPKTQAAKEKVAKVKGKK